MAAQVEAMGGVFEVTKVTQLFAVPGGGATVAGVDVSADGQRFVLSLPPENEAPEALTVVQNWTAALKIGRVFAGIAPVRSESTTYICFRFRAET
jgi:hypothetical protein